MKRLLLLIFLVPGFALHATPKEKRSAKLYRETEQLVQRIKQEKEQENKGVRIDAAMILAVFTAITCYQMAQGTLSTSSEGLIELFNSAAFKAFLAVSARRLASACFELKQELQEEAESQSAKTHHK